MSQVDLPEEKHAHACIQEERVGLLEEGREYQETCVCVCKANISCAKSD